MANGKEGGQSLLRPGKARLVEPWPGLSWP